MELCFSNDWSVIKIVGFIWKKFFKLEIVEGSKVLFVVFKGEIYVFILDGIKNYEFKYSCYILKGNYWKNWNRIVIFRLLEEK